MSSSDNIKVVVRVRPLNQREIDSGYTEAWLVEKNSIALLHPTTGKPIPGQLYCFDRVFPVAATNSEIYEYVAKNLVESAMNGINGTIFAYGQTSSGKTHTIYGTRQNPGILPLAINDIFTYIENTPGREFLLRVSYLEIYNECIKDLLDVSNDNLKVHEDLEKGVFVDAKEEIVTTPGQVFTLLQNGESM